MTTGGGRRSGIARRAADDIEPGWYVNLGIGIPTLIADLVPMDHDIVFHSENGVLGFGPHPDEAASDPWLINAGKERVTLRSGGSFMHHADSFALIRGGHLDLCVLGAFQVAASGDLANWATSLTEIPAIGGAMDLSVGARSVWVLMEHRTRKGEPRLVEECSYPLTAPRVVKRVYTELATLDVTPRGFEVRWISPDITKAELCEATDAPIHFASDDDAESATGGENERA